MYLLLCLAVVLGSVTGVPLTSGNAIRNENDELRAQYVLPGESIPTLYDIRLSFPDSDVYFNGQVTIRVLPVIPTQVLVLHSMEMDIESIQVFAEIDSENEVDLVEDFVQAQDDTHFLTINLNTLINPNVPHFIHITYVARFATNMFGVYRSSYVEDSQDRYLITSQLQPTFARRAFPCYDEPHLKAVFRTTIYAPPNYLVVRSNMPQRELADEIQDPMPGFTKFEFQDTLIMSTYLNAYLVSNFEYIGNDVEDPNVIYPIPFKIFSRPNTQDTAEYALEFGQQNMQALENYTEFQYDFPKIDKVAVPDFAAGAMENWGLVIYREVALLVQDGVTTTAIRQNVARIICHENVHMWFGNEVSPESWTYTWLNEGFANFFENFGTDLVRPGYRMMDQFVLLLQGVMQNDAVLNVNPMTNPVYTPSQILSTFNAVAYQKSGSVIRMMQHFLTPEIFRRGLVIYLQDNYRGATNPSHLYAALQQALDESEHSIPWSLSTIMDRWTTQGGFPVIRVRRTAPAGNSVFVDQERFLTDADLESTDRWHVPINWVLSNNIDFEDTSPQAWVPPATSIDIPGLAEVEWFIVNKKQTGYYRVNYDPENWEALARVLNTTLDTIHLLNRAQIIDDSFNLARNGRLSYLHPLEISHYLVQEKDYIPWASFNTALNYLDIVLSGTEVYDLFQDYMLFLTAPLFEDLGFDVGSGEEHVTPYLRNIILDINCRYGNEACVERAEQLLQNYMTNINNAPNADIQTTVFCSALRGGSETMFNWLLGRYDLVDSSQQSILLNALGCTSNPTLRDNYLSMVTADAGLIREQDRHTIIVSVINSSPENMEAALDFVVENFHLIQPRVQGLTGTTNILNAFARRLNSQEHDTKMDEFVSRHQTIFTAGELAAIGAIRDNIASSITWNDVNLDTVSSWLRENYGNGASALSSSLVIVLSAIFAMYMY